MAIGGVNSRSRNAGINSLQRWLHISCPLLLAGKSIEEVFHAAEQAAHSVTRWQTTHAVSGGGVPHHLPFTSRIAERIDGMSETARRWRLRPKP